MDVVTVLGLLIIFGFFVFLVVRVMAENLANRKKPMVGVRAGIVSKRSEVSGGSGNSSTSTTYYVTFEYDNGLREAFRVSGSEYDLLAEGDQGTLLRQGTWFKGFQREL